MSQLSCSVRHCDYLAESSIDDGEDRFFVCALHDNPKVRGILECGDRPAFYWTPAGFPLVIPCGPLEPEHLVPRAAVPRAIRASLCGMLAAVPAGYANAYPAFDLSRD